MMRKGLIPNQGSWVDVDAWQRSLLVEKSVEGMMQALFQAPDEMLVRKRDIEDWTPEVLTFSRQEGITFLEGWRQFELGWSVERLAKVSRVPMAVILAWEAPSPDAALLDRAAESLGLPRELLDKTLDDYPWLALQPPREGASES